MASNSAAPCCRTRARAGDRCPAAQFGGPDRDLAGARLYRPKGSSVGETTFMVEDYIPERIEFDISAKEKMIKAELRLS